MGGMNTVRYLNLSFITSPNILHMPRIVVWNCNNHVPIQRHYLAIFNSIDILYHYVICYKLELCWHYYQSYDACVLRFQGTYMFYKRFLFSDFNRWLLPIFVMRQIRCSWKLSKFTIDTIAPRRFRNVENCAHKYYLFQMLFSLVC